MQKKFRALFLAAATGSIIAIMGAIPAIASATTTAVTTPATATNKPLYFAAWLPFWTTQAGEQDIAIHLDSLNEVDPFSYEIVSGGAILDDLKIDSGAWSGWFSAIHDAGVKNVPTIAWFDADGIQQLLSSARTRQAEEDKIAALVKNNSFDGIDIDFEGMYGATRPYYSLFIQGLAQRLHPSGKKLTCTVVPRTPLSSLYTTVPTNVVYPENYTVLNQYCDEVRLMAYDQQTVDLNLDASKGNGTLYAPVADPDWVKKVIQLALQSISPKKIMLGIPTYGYEYEVAWNNGVNTYQRVRAFGFYGAMDRADSLGIQPLRNNAGELSFTFTSSTYIKEPPILVSTVPSAIESPELAAPQNPNATTTFFVSFPDAQSEMDKVNLARQFGLKGAAFFKADGQMDPAIWDLLAAK